MTELRARVHDLLDDGEQVEGRARQPVNPCQARAVGFATILRKPYTAGQVMNAIVQLLGKATPGASKAD